MMTTETLETESPEALIARMVHHPKVPSGSRVK